MKSPANPTPAANSQSADHRKRLQALNLPTYPPHAPPHLPRHPPPGNLRSLGSQLRLTSLPMLLLTSIVFLGVVALSAFALFLD